MPIFQPILEQRSAPTMVRPGVQDNSTASRIASFGEQAIDLYTGYQEASLEKDIESTLEEHFKPIRDAEINIAATDMAVDQIWKKASQEAIDVSEVSAVEEIHQKQLNLYQQAVATGKMSAGELETRILAATRSAINRNPGLTDILLKRADRVLEMSGASSYIKSAKEEQISTAKQQEKIFTEIRSQAYQNDISFDPLNPNYAQLSQQLQKKAMQDTAFKVLQQENAEGKLRDEKEASLAIQQIGQDTFMGSIDNFAAQATNLYQQSTTKDYASISSQVDALHNNMINEWYSWGARNKVLSNPEFKELSGRLNTALENTKKRMQTLKSGEDFVKVLKNEVEGLKLTQEKEVREKYNLFTLEVLGKLGPDFIKDYALKSGKNVSAIMGIAGDLVQGFSTNSSVRSMSEKTIDSRQPDAVSLLGKIIETGDKTGISKVLTSFNSGYSSIENPSARLSFLETSVRQLGNVTNTENLKGLQTDGVSSGMNLINTYMNQVAPQMILGINSAMKEKGGEDRVSFDVLPNGTLTVSSSNKDLERKLNTKFIIRINESLAATANIQGVTPKAIASKFYNEHFGKWIPELSTDKDLTEATKKESKAPSPTPGVVVRGEPLGPKVERAVLDFIDSLRD